ncbi:MAG: GIY-YIG nuclease family protein [Aeromonas veronii]
MKQLLTLWDDIQAIAELKNKHPLYVILDALREYVKEHKTTTPKHVVDTSRWNAQLKDILRNSLQSIGVYIVPEDYVYVLAVEQGNFYVGTTKNVLTRLESHCSGRGSTLTKKYRPTHLLGVFKGGLILEKEITIRMKSCQGADRVFGGPWATENKGIGVEALQRYIELLEDTELPVNLLPSPIDLVNYNNRNQDESM